MRMSKLETGLSWSEQVAGWVTWQVRARTTHSRLCSDLQTRSSLDDAVQYAHAQGALVIAVDGGPEKGEFVKSIGASEYIDFKATPNLVQRVKETTNGGAKAVIVTAGNPKAFVQAADMLKVGGTLSCVGIPPEKGFIETPISTIVIKGLHITGNLVGSLKECLEAVDLVRRGVVRPKISIRNFEDLPAVYGELERGDIEGRIVLKVAKDND